ncbi:MAG: GerMN domain-containing protein [Treponema sp.]|nr:GerMN domain-containing protein [Treponema sp.]
MSFIRLIKNDRRFFLFTVLAFLFVFSFIFFVVNYRGARYHFYFESTDTDGYEMEVRQLPSVKGREKIELFTEELLLGPSIQRAKRVFPVGTRAIFCFEHKKVLYLNLSKEALYDFSESASIGQNLKVIEKNIMTNFPSVRKIEFFIEGNSIKFEDKN